MPNRIDTLIAEGSGAARAVKARIDGLVGIFATLCREHGEVDALLKRLKADLKKHSDLWPKIRAELMSHERAEVSELYPVLREFDATRALADRHDDEATALSDLIDEVDRVDPQDNGWRPLFDQLVRTVEHHVAEEESQIFPQAQQAIGTARAKQLEPRFLTAKKRWIHQA